LLTKGARSPYDSAVAIRLDRYREETFKLNFGDMLIDSLARELSLVRAIREDQSNVVASQTYIIQANADALLECQSTTADLKTNYNDLYRLATEGDKWFNDGNFWKGLAVGSIGGLIAAITLMLLAQ